MYYFVSSEQIHANFIALVNEYFNPVEENELQQKIIEEMFYGGNVIVKDAITKVLWQPVIWEIELLEITQEELAQRTGLAPFHKKFKVISGPCMGAITFDDGEDVFDDIEAAKERVISWIDKRLSKLDFVLQSKLRL